MEAREGTQGRGFALSPQFRSLVLTLTLLAMGVVFVRLLQQGAGAAFWRQNLVGLLLFTAVPILGAALVGWLLIAVLGRLFGDR